MRTSTARRCHDDQGAVLVEFALAVPLLIVLALGLLEFGMAYHESIVIDRGLNVAARNLSNGGRNSLADFEALRALDSSLAGVNNSQIKKVIIYKSNTLSDEGAVPAACTSIAFADTSVTAKGSAGLCNVYSRAQVKATTPVGFNPVDSTTCSGRWDAAWCPTTRDQNAPNIDHLGMYVEVEYETITGLLGTDTITLTRFAVFAIEPEAVGGN